MKLVITEKDNKILSLLFDDKRLCDIKVSPAAGCLRGNIYRARVTKVVKHMDACFVDIAKGQSCFLKFSECTGAIPREGDELTVMVHEDAIKTKVPSVTMKLSLSGKNMVVMLDRSSHISISKKITSKSERDRIHNIISDKITSSECPGVIVRTCAQGLPGDVIADEYEGLCSALRSIDEYGPKRTLYSVLYKSRPQYLDALISHLAIDGLEIVTENKEIYEDILSFVKCDSDGQDIKVNLYEDDRVSLYSLYSIETRVQELLAKKVYLKSGGYLVIEQTEALNVIDVNSGKFEKKRNSGEFYSLTNREAALEAARQIRLRNLSGIIIIDFINEESDESRNELIGIMNDEFRRDGGYARVVDITALGLMEITRKKISPSLKELFFSC